MFRIRITSAALATGIVVSGLGVAFAATTTTTTTTTTTDMVGCLSNSGSLSNVQQSTTLPTCSNGKAVGWNAKGVQGPPGLQGNPGNKGDQGNPGNNGKDGLSAYDLWLADADLADDGLANNSVNKTNWPHARWFDSLRGQNGTNGTNGRNGVAGATAPTSSASLTTSGTQRGHFVGDSKVASAYAYCPVNQVPLSGGFDIDPAQMTNAQWPNVIASVPVYDATNGYGWKVTLAAPSGNSALAAITFDATVVCVNNAN